MPLSAARAVQLLAELADLDRKLRGPNPSLNLFERQRRTAICRELGAWAMERQGAPAAAQRRTQPRAAIRVPVRLVGGPHPVELESESLAVGGVSVVLRAFTPRVGDIHTVRMSLGVDAPEEIELMVEVVWVDPVRGRAGMRFAQMTDAERERVEALVLRTLVLSVRGD